MIKYACYDIFYHGKHWTTVVQIVSSIDNEYTSVSGCMERESRDVTICHYTLRQMTLN